MLYNVKSRIDFPDPEGDLLQGHELHRRRLRRLHRHVPLLQDGRPGGAEGHLHEPEAGVNAWRFPERNGIAAVGARPRSGSPTSTRVSTAAARSSTTRWRRSAQRGDPTQAVWDTTYADVDLTRLTDFLELQGIRAGRARLRAQPARMAARQVGAEARRRGDHRDDAGRQRSR